MKAIKVVIFLVVAVGLIWAGLTYNKRIDAKATQNASLAAQQQQESAKKQQEALQKIMEQLKIEDTVVGTGAVAENGKSVTVHYVGTLDNGTKFDSSRDHGQPFTFALGTGEVIQGWDLGVAGMKVGGTRKLIIPAELGYGSNAIPGIPANSTLHFTVELLEVK